MQEVVGSTPIFSTKTKILKDHLQDFFVFIPILDITRHKNNHIELHLGTYFGGGFSTFSGFFMVLVMTAIIIILAKDLIPEAGTKTVVLVGLFIFFGIFLNLFLGFEGIEFDLDKKEFRRYVKRLGIKVGKWKDLRSYTMLCLSAQYNRSLAQSPTGLRGGAHRSLEINLASSDQKSILLAECKNYKEAEKTIQELNQFLQLEIKDFVKEEYMKPSPQR